MSQSAVHVGWKVSVLSSHLASVRYRALLPIIALEDDGCRFRLFSDASTSLLDDLDVLVIVKSLTVGDYFLAQEAVARGIPVVLDLCDNIFVDSYGAQVNDSPADMFVAIARLARAVVVTTEPLAAVVRDQVNGGLPVYVVPDGIETAPLLDREAECLSQAIALQRGNHIHRLRRMVRRVVRHIHRFHAAEFLPLILHVARRAREKARGWYRASRVHRHIGKLLASMTQGLLHIFHAGSPSTKSLGQEAKRILWFGNHGAPHARFGILDLLEIQQELECISVEFDVELVVVSNSIEKYQKYIRPLAIRSRYVEWSNDVVAAELGRAAVVLVPNSKDPFSLCKSANRTVLALAHGVPVVATATPALEPLAGCIVLDDFAGGLRLYLGTPERAQADVANAQECIQRHFGQAAIAAAWRSVLGVVHGKPLPRVEPAPQLLVALHLIQDLDLALPILGEAKSRGISVLAICSTTLIGKSPRVMAALRANGIEMRSLPDDHDLIRAFDFPMSARVLLTAAETNLGPHHFTHMLTKGAHHAGLFTATLQHGFENVGLTYDDEIHRVGKIDFAADRVYLWGPLSTLHPQVPLATRGKCVPVGCPKLARPPAADLSELLGRSGRVIGIFENLHWHRYSDAYRQFFLEGVLALVEAFPDTTFLVKPHHAGRWLTLRPDGANPSARNFVIADPASPKWEAHTAASLMGQMSAVITTPSTVALDAARRDLPVAVVARDLDLINYSPLRRIINSADWISFVHSLDNVDTCRALVAASVQYAGHVLMAGNAAQRIVDDLVSAACLRPGNTSFIAGDALPCSG